MIYPREPIKLINQNIDENGDVILTEGRIMNLKNSENDKNVIRIHIPTKFEMKQGYKHDFRVKILKGDTTTGTFVEFMENYDLPFSVIKKSIKKDDIAFGTYPPTEDFLYFAIAISVYARSEILMYINSSSTAEYGNRLFCASAITDLYNKLGGTFDSIDNDNSDEMQKILDPWWKARNKGIDIRTVSYKGNTY